MSINYGEAATAATLGASLGASLGSVVPGIGTAIGGAVGGVVGAVASFAEQAINEDDVSPYDPTDLGGWGVSLDRAGDIDPFFGLELPSLGPISTFENQIPPPYASDGFPISSSAVVVLNALAGSRLATQVQNFKAGGAFPSELVKIQSAMKRGIKIKFGEAAKAAYRQGVM